MAIIDDLGASLEKLPGGGVALTTLDGFMGWSRSMSEWTYPLGTACCAMEYIASSFSRFDFDRHGSIPRSDPRHCDVMVVAGTITRKMAPVLKRLYEQMPDPKWVIAMGNCTVSGGIFYYDSYSVVRGIDEIVPVDIYLAGCPPRPEAFQDAVLQLRAKIKAHSIAPSNERPVRSTLPNADTPRKGEGIAEGGERS
ncbi:MAG: NADH-quinone oxidoreductase subunit B family protein [Coriobacteriales bacterium]